MGKFSVERMHLAVHQTTEKEFPNEQSAEQSLQFS